MCDRLSCLKPLGGSVSAVRDALQPQMSKCNIHHSPPLVAVAINLVKVHLHHVDPTAS